MPETRQLNERRLYLRVPAFFHSVVVALLCCLKYRMLPFYISLMQARESASKV